MNGEQIRYGEMHSTTVTSYGFSRKIKYRPLSNSTKYVSTDSTFLEGIARRNPEFFKPTNGYVPEAFAFRMRCMKKLHRIIVFPNGEVTLTSHLGEVASKLDEMYRWSHGEECACRQFKNAWVKALDNRWYSGDDVKSMPAKARKLLKIIAVWAKRRRSVYGGAHYVMERKGESLEQNIRTRNLETDAQFNRYIEEVRNRTSHLRKKIIYDRSIHVFGEYRWGAGDLRSVAKRSKGSIDNRRGPSFGFDSERDWCGPLIAAGLLQANLVSTDRSENLGRPVMPIRILDYGWMNLDIPEGNLLVEALDKYGRTHFIEVEEHPVRMFRWRVAKTHHISCEWSWTK